MTKFKKGEMCVYIPTGQLVFAHDGYGKSKTWYNISLCADANSSLCADANIIGYAQEEDLIEYSETAEELYGY